MKMKRMLKILAVVVLLTAAAGGGYWFYQNKVAAALAATSQASTGSPGYSQVVAVKSGSLDSAITEVGTLEAVQSADLAFEHLSSSTKVASLDIKAGNTITTGQVLSSVDPTPYQQALDQAKSQLAADEKTLTDLKTPATALEIAQADATIADARQQILQAKSDLADLLAPDMVSLQNAVKDAQDSLSLLALQTTLAERDSSAKSERDLQYSVSWYERRINELQALSAAHKANAEQIQELTDDQTKLSEAQADLAKVQSELDLAAKARAADLIKDQAALTDAQTALAKAQAGGDKVALAKDQVAVQDAEVALQSAQDARTKLDEGSDATDIATAQAAVDKDKIAVANAQTALEGTKIVAPFDGTVLATNVNAGDLVSSSTTILSVANLKSLQVLASIDETTIRKIANGQAATISFDAFPGQTFTGTVQSVPLEGSLQGGVTVYDVPISLNGAEKVPLLVGMTANVKIQLAKVEDALLVPTLALQESNGQYSVLVPNQSDATAQPDSVPVEVGMSNGTYTQITKGLNAGDNVVAEIAAVTTNNNFGNQNGATNLIMQTSRTLSGR
jgi:HlyD family secretion protein